MSSTTIEVGMTVYFRPTIYNKSGEILDGTLTKIDDEYYTVISHSQEYKFYVSCRLEARRDYSSPNYTLYFSREKLDNEVEYEKLRKQITTVLLDSIGRDNYISLDQMRKIAVVLEIIPPLNHKDFTICFEMSGGLTVKAETAEQAKKIFSKMSAFEIYENANPAVITGILEDKDNVIDKNKE